MLFDSIKEINRSRKEINRLLSKEINRLRKEINRLLSKRMPNIYLKVTIEAYSKLRFSGFKKFVTRSDFAELQVTQILLNFKTSCCNLKLKGLVAKLCAAFLLY